MDLSAKTDKQIEVWIRNHEAEAGATARPLYQQLLEERACRAQVKQRLNLETSLQVLKGAAERQVCVAYGELAKASGVDWSQARHQMNGPGGHLDLLLDLCHARGLPLLPALCVNQEGVASGELGEAALAGFVSGARRLGLSVTDGRTFHHECRDQCWEWGRRQAERVEA